MKKFWNTMVPLQYGTMRTVASAYILLPVALFFIGFLRWYFALIGLCALGVAYYSILKSRDKNTRCLNALKIRLPALIGLFLIMLLWCQLGGLNGYLYQSSDFNCRNAIFRDLITHRWPVVYESSNSALVYYVGHWLPAALVGKVANALFHNDRFTWFAGRMALWAWTAMGISIVALLLFLYTNAISLKKRMIVLLVFIFFSGLDVIATFWYGKQDMLFGADVLHLEWWSPKAYQYSSMTSCLFWVFNQSVIPWIATLCFLMDENERNYIAYGTACMICSPLPLIGLAILMVCRAMCRLVGRIRAHAWLDWLKSVFSPGNMAVLIFCIPILMIYIFGNNAIGATSESTYTAEKISFFSAEYWTFELFQFFMLEVGCYLVLIWNAHKKNPLFYAIALSLLCIPYFHVGVGTDFCMRASIPGVFIVMVYVADYLSHHLPSRKTENKRVGRAKRVCAVLLLLVFLCGAATPYMEFYRGMYHVITERTYKLANDTIITFDNGTVSTNFSTANADQQFFYKYLAR